MAYELIFKDINDDTELRVCNNDGGDIFISLQSDSMESFCTILLDTPTAIKFAKTLRTEINKAKEGLNE